MEPSVGPAATNTLERPKDLGPRYLLVPALDRLVAVGSKPVVIGTGPDCDLQLEDPAVSRLHCEVRRGEEGRVLVRDLQSKNGLVLQSVRVSAGEMRVGDTLRLGATVVLLTDQEVGGSQQPGEVLPGVVGTTEVMQRLARTVRLLAPSDLNVLVTGETGTGKELMARALHRLSPRGAQPFVALNCGAIARDLIESELFGHERGAFTGALEARPGLFEQAAGSTLLLDEIGELPLAQQPKLLRVLETRRVRRLGGRRARPVDVRVVAATHVDLPAAVEAGRFRQDLYYRIAEATVRVPALAEHREDILPLVDRFRAELAAGGPRMGPEVMLRLQQRHYRGNVRELRSLVRRAAVLGWSVVDEGDTQRRPVEGAWATAADGASRAAEARATTRATFDEIQRRVLLEALEQAEGNKALAARRLGMAKSTFNDRLRRLS